jgi:hypothetical protein
MIQYDEAVLREFAHELYKEARFILASRTILGAALLGGAVAVFGPQLLKDRWPFFAVAAALFGGLFGYQSARLRALDLKTKAQQLLCWREIEANTRK